METETTIASTPMTKVWKVIAATMIGTLLIGYAIHEMRMSTLRAQNDGEIKAVQVNIAKLAAYRDQLQASTSVAEIPQ